MTGSGGTLLGIARHARPKAPVELVDAAEVTLEGGIAGDFRGAMRGKPYKRQITLLERGDWEAALREVERSIPWQERRVNLLVDGFDLPQRAGALIRIGARALLEVTCECDPCARMDAIADGLRLALTPDWRGGVCTIIRMPGRIAVGDEIRIEDQWPNHSEHSTISVTFPASECSSARI